MVKMLIIAIKIALVVGAFIWLASRPGDVTINWMDYKITADLGLSLVAALGFILLTVFIYRLVQMIGDAPKHYAIYRDGRKKDKGFKALTLGLTAVAAGDAKLANYQSFRAKKFLGETQGLSLLLEAQAARLNGDESAANKSFAALLKNPDTAFLGVRGLLQAAIDHGRGDKALDYGYEALRLHPRQPWILRTVYDLELRQHSWDKADKLLKRLEKTGAVKLSAARSDRAAMQTAQGREALEKDRLDEAARHLRAALKYDDGFAAAAISLGDVYLRQGHQKKTKRMVQNTLPHAPHPGLITLWARLIPLKAATDKLARLQWMEKLEKFNGNSAAVQLALAKAALDGGLWGEARAHLEKAEKLDATKSVYRLYADLEALTTKDDEAIAGWHDKAATAPDDPHWYCKDTGLAVPDWRAFNPYSGAFNDIVWGHPGVPNEEGDAVDYSPASVLEAPK